MDTQNTFGRRDTSATPPIGHDVGPKTSRRGLIIVSTILVLLSAGYSVFWLNTADRVLRYLDEWKTHAIAPDLQITWRSVTTSGFPFSLKVTIENPTASDSRGLEWATERIDLHTRPWDWTTVTLRAPHTHKIVTADAATPQMFLIDTNSLDATFTIRADGLLSSDITASNVIIRDDQNQEVTMRTVLIKLEANPRASPVGRNRTGKVWYSIADIHSVMFSRLSLGERIDKMSGDIEIFGPLPQALTSTQLLPWRQAGGVVEVRSLGVLYGPLSLHTEGTLALDAALQPVGAFTAQILGFHESVDALQDAGQIGSGEAFTAKLVLGALAQTDPATGKSSMNIPVSIQDRTLYVGPLNLGEIPWVDWSE